VLVESPSQPSIFALGKKCKDFWVDRKWNGYPASPRRVRHDNFFWIVDADHGPDRWVVEVSGVVVAAPDAVKPKSHRVLHKSISDFDSRARFRRHDG